MTDKRSLRRVIERKGDKFCEGLVIESQKEKRKCGSREKMIKLIEVIEYKVI